jgi:Conserved region of Rad21 / Rec8 like protein
MGLGEGEDDHLVLDNLPFKDLLLRPALGDDGQLAPELLQLWQNNLASIKGKPSPYRLHTPVDKHENTAMEENLPQPDGSDDEYGGLVLAHRRATDSDEEQPMPFEDDDDDDEEAKPNKYDEDGSSQMSVEEKAGGEGEENKYCLGNWGLVNEAFGYDGNGDEDHEEDQRQESGTELASSSCKWHKHTVSVLLMLQRNMGNAGPVDEDKNCHLVFGECSKNFDRRTATGVFFEILQLKTWDFVKVEQKEAYGDIRISPGNRFAEEAPSDE